MPEMDGLEVTRRIRQAEAGGGEHLPIIAMTAHALEEVHTSCLESGMDGFVTKPIRDEQLWSEIRRVLPPAILTRPATESLPEVCASRAELAEATRPAEPVAQDKPRTPGNAAELSAEDAILARVGGNRELLGSLQTIFQADTKKLLAEIYAACEEKDPARMRIAAHTLKGMLGFFMADRATEIVRQLEELARGESWYGTESLVVDLTREIQVVIEKVSALRSVEKKLPS
jgi:CheY-like chemotaxis protein